MSTATPSPSLHRIVVVGGGSSSVSRIVVLLQSVHHVVRNLA
jgi:hypothetical protein